MPILPEDFAVTPWGLRELGKKKIKEQIEETKLIDDIDPKTFNIEILKNILLYFLYWSQPHKNIGYIWPENSKIFIIYLYSVIKATKQKCDDLIQLIVNKDKKFIQQYIEWEINTYSDKKDEIQFILNEARNCYLRFSIYETMLKDILLINPKENNETELVKLFPEWNKIPIEAHELLQEYIINPIFYGKFSFNLKDKKFLILENNNLIEILFPFPSGLDNNQSLPDGLLIFSLIKQFGGTIKFARDYFKTWTSVVDSTISAFTGKKKGYVFEFGKASGELYDEGKKTAKNAYNSAAGIASDMTEFTKSVYGAISGISSGVNDLTETLKPLAALIGVGLAFSVLGKLVD